MVNLARSRGAYGGTPPARAPPGASEQAFWQWLPNPNAAKGVGKGVQAAVHPWATNWDRNGVASWWGTAWKEESDWRVGKAAGKGGPSEREPKRRKKQLQLLPEEEFEPDPEVQLIVEQFLADNEVDEKASTFLRTRRPDVQQLVVEQGSLMDAQKPSAALMIRIARVMESLVNGTPVRKRNTEVQEQVETFLATNPVDEKAQRMIRTQKLDVKLAVLAGGDLMNCANPSSALMKRVMVARNAIQSDKVLGQWQGDAVGDPYLAAAVDRFLDENPVDERASSMLRSQPPDVQVQAMELGSIMHCENPNAGLIARISDSSRKSNGLGRAGPKEIANLFWWKDYDPAGITIGRAKVKQSGKDFCLLATLKDPDEEIYADKATVDPEAFGNGDFLAFKSHHEPEFDGPEADAPVWKLVGTSSGSFNRSLAGRFGTFRGHINKVMGNGSAFVNCPDAHLMHGQNAFIHGKVMEQCALEKGDIIAFEVHINKQEQPQVSNPVWKCISDMSAKLQ